VLFELDRYDKSLHLLPPAAPEHPYRPASFSEIEQISLLYWAEHCVECAAPSCYESCDLYHPRADLRCRRFTFGAYKNANFASLHTHGVEIAFKKWAKIEAYGNWRLFPARNSVRAEKIAEWVAPAVNVLGNMMARLTHKDRWRALTHILLEASARQLAKSSPRRAGDAPDVFLLEIYNPATEVLRMQLSFSQVSSEPGSKNALVQLSSGFTSRIACSSGYSRHEIDFALVRDTVSSGVPFVIQLIPEADSEARLVFLNANFVKFSARNHASKSKDVKCLVFDLDHTLWQGVLVEGDEVIAHSEMVRLIKHLDERGILLSIASKNDRETAWKKVQSLGLSEYFLYPQINWNPKSYSIKTIAERLNLGVDTIAFIDDNPFELDEVARALPEVVCIHKDLASSLFSDPRFRGGVTHDARRRRQLYRDAETREMAQESFGSDYLGFLASCEIQLEVSSYSPPDSERVAELVQRTNQLNFSGRKHTRPALQEILSDPLLDKFVLKSSDRYGDHGIIGFCVAERSATKLLVREFTLSCRVQGKLVEKAFFNHLVRHHYRAPLEELWIDFRKTPRNTPAQHVLESMRFLPCGPDSAEFQHGMICSTFESLDCDIIQVACSCFPSPPSPSEPALSSKA
jgi:FkbH-like protein